MWGQAGTVCQLLQRGAGHRVVLRCCAPSGQAGIILPVISVLYPTLPVLRMRNPWMAVRDLQLAVSLHHLLPMPVEPSRGECPRLCTDRVALAQLLQPPASVCSFLGMVLPTIPNHFHRERTATPPGPHLYGSPEPVHCSSLSRLCALHCPRQVPVPQHAVREQELVSCPSTEASRNCKRHPIFWKLSSDNK